ncbi:MAG: hypothetical protein ABEJ27_06135 [Halodesulfurarchaeum sp.]
MAGSPHWTLDAAILSESSPSHAVEDTLTDVLRSRSAFWTENPFQTIAISHIGKCRRQLYLSTLGLLRTADTRGRIEAGNALQSTIETKLQSHFSDLKTSVNVRFEHGDAQYIGRINGIDSTGDLIVDVKPRAEWYKFNPPIRRHLDQLQAYLHGIDAEHGRILYVSLKDYTDYKLWPPADATNATIDYDPDRVNNLFAKVDEVRAAILEQGIPTSPGDIPFERCGCYLCSSESLSLPQPPDVTQESSTSSDQKSPAQTQTETDMNQSDSSGDSPHEFLRAEETIEAPSNSRHVPADLKDHGLWVVWAPPEKTVRAPWDEGHMYPAPWAATNESDPRTDYDTARMVAELPVEEIHASWPFPESDTLPTTVKPGILLPHDSDASSLLVVDLDDVRDPDSGATTREAMDIIQALGGYTEISWSGKGFHVYVRASLPDNSSVLRFSLPSQGTVEIYDQSRFIAGTWNHLDTTPENAVPTAQPTTENMIDCLEAGETPQV